MDFALASLARGPFSRLFGASRRAGLATALTAVFLVVFAGSPNAQAATLEAVRMRGQLICGINPNLPGFGYPDKDGAFKGFNADLCRAVAAAVLGDPAKVKFVPLTATIRFEALTSGEVDLLTHNSSWTMQRDTGAGLHFTGVTFFDGQSFMVKKSAGITAATDLGGASVCTQQGSTSELNAADFFRAHRLRYEIVSFASDDDAAKAFGDGRCDVLTSDTSALAAARLKLADADNYAILPELISKEPLGLVVRDGDDKWFDIVRWTTNALIDAEELGITQANAAEAVKSPNPEVKRLLGVEGKFGSRLGLSEDWAMRAVQAGGNYGEIFERNLGGASPLKLPRGMNALWSKGGILYAPPIR
ncbi:MAG: amino acid ABC transporter substrate-binding protein [Hyphomicrobiales bacterium]|nr:amino acid ABC transporter substrate-binding protein [Hyphomicrobiales bacterium]MBV8770403.1 amino acid ABC transporter substrate-binding protein [Hyphomicrobiales bacterium]